MAVLHALALVFMCSLAFPRFLKDEPQRLENALKRCKKLSGTLYTLKR